MDVIDDYDERTAAYIADTISSESFTTEELMAIKEYEVNEHKNRVTVTNAVDRVLAMRDDGPEPEPEPEPEPAVEPVPEEEEDDLDDIITDNEATDRRHNTDMANNTTTDDTDTRPNDGDESTEEVRADTAVEGNDRDPDTVRVKLANPRSGYAAGHLFEDAHEVKEVRFNRRVELALERGELQYA